jgi:hypothetical protein
MVTVLSKPLDHNDLFEFESDNETAEVKIDFAVHAREALLHTIVENTQNKKFTA